MGTDLSFAPSALADALFTPVQQRVLGLLFGQPNRRFQSAEIIEKVAAGTGATHRVLKRLAEAGLLAVTNVGRQKYYQANAEAPLYEELVSISRKTVGLLGPLKQALEPLGDSVRTAFVYGSVAKGTDTARSDVDLMIIGDDLDYPTVFEAVQSAELVLDRPVNPTIMAVDEWRRKRGEPDSFIRRVIDGPTLSVIGDSGEL